MKTKENKNEIQQEKPVKNIQDKKSMPKADNYGDIPTIGEAENWSGYPDW